MGSQTPANRSMEPLQKRPPVVQQQRLRTAHPRRRARGKNNRGGPARAVHFSSAFNDACAKTDFDNARHSDSGLRRAAIISATTETAISSGVIAPMSNPMGAKTRSKAPARNALFLEFLHHADHFPLAPDHGDVARRRRDRPAQHAHVVAMPARHDNDVTGVPDRELRENLLVLFGVNLVRFGEAVSVREGLRDCPRSRSRSRRCSRPSTGSSRCGRRRK